MEIKRNNFWDLRKYKKTFKQKKIYYVYSKWK